VSAMKGLVPNNVFYENSVIISEISGLVCRWYQKPSRIWETWFPLIFTVDNYRTFSWVIPLKSIAAMCI